MIMDEQPDILSSGPRQRPGARRHGPGRGGWIAIFVLVLLGCLGVTTGLALLVSQRDDTINDLRAALRDARHPVPAAVALPAVSASAMFTLPDVGGGSFSVVAAAVRPDPGSATLTWMFVYGRHAIPGERYGVIEERAEASTSLNTTWRTAPRTGRATSRSWRPTWPSAPRRPMSGSCCTGGRRHAAWRYPGSADWQRREDLPVHTAVLSGHTELSRVSCTPPSPGRKMAVPGRYASPVSPASIAGMPQAWTRRLLHCGVAAGLSLSPALAGSQPCPHKRSGERPRSQHKTTREAERSPDRPKCGRCGHGS